MNIDEILTHFENVKKSGSEYMVRCPCHKDNKQSLAIGRGTTGIVMKCHAGCDTHDILRQVGLKPNDLFYEARKPSEPGKYAEIVATYTYPNGAQKIRRADKTFAWRRSDGKGGYTWGRQGIPHCLYVAGELAESVIIVEGEKDADNLHKLGFDAVSGEDGAGPGKWRAEYTEQLKGKNVLIMQDNDKVGKDYAQETAAALHGVAASIILLDLATVWPDIPEHGDISDFIAKFGAERSTDIIAKLYTSTPEWKPAGEVSTFDSFGFYSVPDLTEDEKKPPEFIIQDLIPCGMTFLSGAPKIRKSFLALQMSIAVAAGQPFFGHVTKQCDVAYLDLEGSKSRISYRAAKMQTAIPRNVYITNSIPERLADGLVDKLRQLHREKPTIRLIIIDTYSRARGSVKYSGANAYDSDVALLEPVQRMAIDENIAVVFIHHDRKGASFVADSFERLSGTMGISGSSDCVINLVADGKRFDGKATLEYTPRDAKGGEIKLVFDERFGQWQQFIEQRPDLLEDPICSWIIAHKPQKRESTVFCAYADLYQEVYGYSSAEADAEIRLAVDQHKAQLIEEYGISVRTGARRRNGRGIAIALY